MSTREVTQDQILGALHGLEPERWPKVLMFIEYLRFPNLSRSAGSLPLAICCSRAWSGYGRIEWMGVCCM